VPPAGGAGASRDGDATPAGGADERAACCSSGERWNIITASPATSTIAAASSGTFTGHGTSTTRASRRYHGRGRAAITRSTKPAGARAGSVARSKPTVRSKRSHSRAHSAHVARWASSRARSSDESASSTRAENSSRMSWQVTAAIAPAWP